MQTKSRRAFLAGTATAATALAAGCVPVALAASSPDAELIRLGANFARARAAWVPLHHECNRLNTAWAEEAFKAKGLNFMKNERAIMAIHDRLGVQAADDANEEALAVLDDLAVRIRSIRPTTMAGLAVWARVTRFDIVSAKAEETAPSARDYDDKAAIALFDLIDAMAVQS